MLKNIERRNYIPPSLEAWQGRRAELREILWGLLTAGEVPRPTACEFEVFMEGDEAEAHLRNNLEKYLSYFPECRSHGPHFNFSWEGEKTWDTKIISYPGWEGEPPQRAVLRVPRSLKVPAPAVMCFHGHIPGCFIGKEEMAYLAEPLAAQGFVTLAPDALRFGEQRDTTLEDADLNTWKGMAFYSERNLAMPLTLTGHTFLGAMIWQHTVAVDMLSALPYVDASRIGAIGMSMGGIQTFWLSAMDERIACGVEVCGMCSYRVWAIERTLNALVCFIPHILRHTDSGEVGGLIAPRPFLCLDAANDGFFPVEGIRESGEVMGGIYKLHNTPNHFRQDIHPGQHVFTPEHLQMAKGWLMRWLQPVTSLGTTSP